MPRYYFDISSPDAFMRDDVGVEFDDLGQVEAEAIKGARGIMAEDLKAGRTVDHQQFEVRDEAGDIVLTIRLRDVPNLPVDTVREPKSRDS